MGNKHKLFLACTIFALTFIIAFFPIISKDGIIAPVNELRVNPFFNINNKPSPQLKGSTYDPIHQFIPWLHFNKESLKHHELPLWNPYQGCGVPHIANIQSGLFLPA
ncbi:MAG: hypothetical protein M1381_10450 [Deltaproteobacteria bacterium]|nr:hypothetical protein [Deltaproteobacteria bacterium]MCL5792686.1 hypothetical protein [Deltaproteobacteria bacterium]